MATDLARACSFLFVPATRPERYAKALASGADCVIVDLEDAVAPADKDGARGQLGAALEAAAMEQRARTLVRINATGSRWHADDCALLAQWARRGLAGAMLPKAEAVADLVRLASTLGPGSQLVPLVETLQGLDAIDRLAQAPGVTRLAFGNLDFQLDVGMRCGDDESALLPVRTAIVLASRRAGIAAPIDGVTVDTSDARACEAAAQRARSAGFGGKLCIHPTQVAIVNAAFAPTPAERDWARRVLEAEAANAGGAFTVDGRMVDAPVLAAARKVLAAG